MRGSKDPSGHTRARKFICRMIASTVKT